MRRRLIPFLVCAAVFASPPRSVRAQEPAAMIVDRQEAARIAALHGPAVWPAEAPRAGIAETRDASSALMRPMTATLSAGYRAGAITPGPEIVVTVMQDVPLRGVGSARRDVAAGLRDVVERDVARVKLDAAARGALAWIGAVEAREIGRLRRDVFAQAQALTDTTHKRFDAGVALPYERALADAELGGARAAVLDAEGVEVEALAELRFALGVEPDRAVEARGDLYTSDDGAAAVTPREIVTAHPALEVARARAQTAAAEARLTSATLGPTIGLGAQYVREGSGDQIALGVVSLPLPLFDPARFDVGRQHAAAAVALAELEHARAALAHDRALATHDREHWREVRNALKNGALAANEEALRLARAQYEAGSHDVTIVLLASQRLAATREALAHAAAEVQRADVRFARAMGTLENGRRTP